jgi:glycosyltransferase involved in cell wall biosynthesis
LGDVEQLVGTVSRLMCCSEGVKQFAENAGFPSEQIELVPITFVPTPPPTEVQQAATRQLYQLGTEPFLLFVGDITANKGVYDLLAAYLEWSKVNPRIPLLLAGVNREGQNFTQEVAKVKGARYLGSIPHIDALGLIAQAEVLLLPSRSEGLPRTILEAISLGTKVVCPPNIPEFERHLPEWTLPEVSPQAILNTLMQVWHTKSVPSYPFEVHALDHIVQQITRIYHDLGKS